jgi:hypothetical protein
MDTKITSTIVANRFGTSRGHENLDVIAAAFNKFGAINTTSACSVSLISNAVAMDRAHVTRIIDGKPGFVKVVQFYQGDRKVGYYFMADKFLTLARQQGAEAYPINTYSLFDMNMPRSITLSDGTVGMHLSPELTKPKSDIKVESLTGHWPAFIVEAVKVSPDRLQKVLTRDYLSMAAGIIMQYQREPAGSLLEFDNYISALISLRQWLSENGNDPEASLMLGADNEADTDK